MTNFNSYNCFICASEFAFDELHSIALVDSNIAKYKICESCLNLSNPDNDYEEVKNIVDSYLNFNQNKSEKISKVSKILDKLGLNKEW